MPVKTLFNPLERARVLRQYGGIFPNNIKEYSEKYIRKTRTVRNFSR